MFATISAFTKNVGKQGLLISSAYKYASRIKRFSETNDLYKCLKTSGRVKTIVFFFSSFLSRFSLTPMMILNKKLDETCKEISKNIS